MSPESQAECCLRIGELFPTLRRPFTAPYEILGNPSGLRTIPRVHMVKTDIGDVSFMPNRTHRNFHLDDWLVQPAQCRLSKDARTVQVRPKVMDLLTYLAAHSGEVLSKDQLLDCVWGAEAVSESALTRTVTELRQALGDDARNPRLLETIPKRGYRLIGAVSVGPAEGVGRTLYPPPQTAATTWPPFGRLMFALAVGWVCGTMSATGPSRRRDRPLLRTGSP